MWDLREDVVHYVVLDDSVEDVASDKPKLAVNRRHCPLLVCPSTFLVMRRFRVRVVQVRDCDWSG
jgi:hypothetical protein